MIMLTCKQACDRATDHIEGPTSFGQRLLLLAHLTVCKHCRRFYRQLRIAIGVTPTVHPEPAPTETEIETLLQTLIRR